MQARRCHGCAAPLPQAIEGEPYRCPFCGLLHDVATPTAGIHIQIGQPVASRRTPRWVVAVFAFAVLATVLPVVGSGLAVWFAASSINAPRAALSGVLPGPSARTTANLADLPFGFHALEAARPTGNLATLDVVAAVPWALAIAQAWAPDARLERVDVERLRPDGTINVLDDRDAVTTYRFLSAARATALRQQGRVQADAEAITGFWVRLKAGRIEVYGERNRATSLRREELPPHPDAMAMPELFTAPPVKALAHDLPFLKGYLIHLEREGWVWYFSSLANETRPRVRARDAAVWPYGRPAASRTR